MAKKAPSDRLAARAQVEMDQQTTRLADKLKGELSSGDAQNVSTAGWHQMIRDNWQDPAWRAREAQRLGNVPLVEDFLKAHALPPLRQVIKTVNPQPVAVAPTGGQAPPDQEVPPA